MTEDRSPCVSLLDLPLLTVDVETTGRDITRGHRICELALLPWGASERIGLVTIVRPDRRVTQRCVALHGLDSAILRQGPRFEALASYVADMLSVHVLVGHSPLFDLRFLAAEFERLNLSVPPVSIIDTLALARRLLPTLPSHRLSSLAQALALPSHQLPSHTAYVDASLAGELLKWFIQHSGVSSAHDAGATRVDWRTHW